MNKYKKNILKASIDIGTNSCRLLIAEMKNEEIVKIIYKDLEIVKLGEDVNKNKFLKETAIDRTITALKKYRKILDNFSILPENIFCFATSATRDSSNKDYFIERVLKETGIKVNCISGEKEAFINFKGVCSAFKTEKNILVFDIGGGSTEFTLGNSSEIKESVSLDIGSVRLTEQFFLKNDNSYDYSEENILAASKYILNELEKLRNFKNYEFDLIGVAGTTTTQVSVKEKMEEYDSDKIHLSILSKADISNNLKIFLKDIPANLDVKGLEAKRRDVIIGGTVILKNILEYFTKDSLQVSEADNLIGAILEKI